MARAGSPSGGSTLTTVAPSSARTSVAKGPGRSRERSRTRMPSSIPGSPHDRDGGRHLLHEPLRDRTQLERLALERLVADHDLADAQLLHGLEEDVERFAASHLGAELHS